MRLGGEALDTWNPPLGYYVDWGIEGPISDYEHRPTLSNARSWRKTV